MRAAGTWSIVVVLAGGLLAGCGSTPAICSGLDDGRSTLAAARAAYGDARGDPALAAARLREGASTVRSACAEHGRAADELDAYARAVARQVGR